MATECFQEQRQRGKGQPEIFSEPRLEEGSPQGSVMGSISATLYPLQVKNERLQGLLNSGRIVTVKLLRV
jgi:hypothetical protein